MPRRSHSSPEFEWAQILAVVVPVTHTACALSVEGSALLENGQIIVCGEAIPGRSHLWRVSRQSANWPSAAGTWPLSLHTRTTCCCLVGSNSLVSRSAGLVVRRTPRIGQRRVRLGHTRPHLYLLQLRLLARRRRCLLSLEARLDSQFASYLRPICTVW